MPTAARIILFAILFYCAAYHIIRYLIQLHLYKSALKERMHGPPKAYYPQITKPNFLNINKPNNGKKSIKKNLHKHYA